MKTQSILKKWKDIKVKGHFKIRKTPTPPLSFAFVFVSRLFCFVLNFGVFFWFVCLVFGMLLFFGGISQIQYMSFRDMWKKRKGERIVKVILPFIGTMSPIPDNLFTVVLKVLKKHRWFKVQETRRNLDPDLEFLKHECLSADKYETPFLGDPLSRDRGRGVCRLSGLSFLCRGVQVRSERVL